MRTTLCDTLGIDLPIIGFTPSEHVAAAISRAGGLGVLGCVRFNDADELDKVLGWMDANTGGRPYGVDVVMPAKVPDEVKGVDPATLIPAEHREFVDRTLAQLGVPELPEGQGRDGVLGWLHSVARSHVEVALEHPIALIANALGSPPADVIAQAHDAGVPVAALAGKAEHAARHVERGVDFVVAQGHEAGGHTGEIASMVLLPEIVDAVGDRAPVLAAGGIGSGRQAAAALALGAQGVWTGSIWLATRESVRTRIYTGKPARLLKTRWTEAWSQPDAPEPLPMPLQNLLVAPAHNRIHASSDPSVVSMPVGQIVGRMNEVRPVADVVADLASGFTDAVTRLTEISDA
ncbi:monooxygenase [Streptomyces regensis]|nr:monooxygenase [Streptomyces regensis]